MLLNEKNRTLNMSVDKSGEDSNTSLMNELLGKQNVMLILVHALLGTHFSYLG